MALCESIVAGRDVTRLDACKITKETLEERRAKKEQTHQAHAQEQSESEGERAEGWAKISQPGRQHEGRQKAAQPQK
ncbi:MAG: hypothetical protein ABIR71_11395 [Chthoniobacterales bacterium]